MDILRELDEEELNFIINKLKSHVPYSIKNLYYIESAQKFKARAATESYSDKVLPTFYTHRHGVKEHCTIFGITGERIHTVWYFSFDETLNEIRECLENTKLIRWGSQFLFVTIHTEQISPILDYAAKNHFVIEENKENSYIFLPIEEALKTSFEIPPETVLVPLSEDDAPLCNTLWAFKSRNSELWVKSLILVNGGYALRDKDTNELLSFGMINDHLAIGLLTTVEKAQRKGYAGVIIRCLAIKLAESGITPTSFVTNPVAFNLFKKLNFKRIGASNWIFMAKSQHK